MALKNSYWRRLYPNPSPHDRMSEKFLLLVPSCQFLTNAGVREAGGSPCIYSCRLVDHENGEVETSGGVEYYRELGDWLQWLNSRGYSFLYERVEREELPVRIREELDIVVTYADYYRCRLGAGDDLEDLPELNLRLTQAAKNRLKADIETHIGYDYGLGLYFRPFIRGGEIWNRLEVSCLSHRDFEAGKEKWTVNDFGRDLIVPPWQRRKLAQFTVDIDSEKGCLVLDGAVMPLWSGDIEELGADVA